MSIYISTMEIKKRETKICEILRNMVVFVLRLMVSILDFLIVSGTLLTSIETINEITWDYVVLDEGHKIQNHNTKISKALLTVNSLHRILLTGTPIMNNLRVRKLIP